MGKVGTESGMQRCGFECWAGMRGWLGRALAAAVGRRARRPSPLPTAGLSPFASAELTVMSTNCGMSAPVRPPGALVDAATGAAAAQGAWREAQSEEVRRRRAGSAARGCLPAGLPGKAWAGQQPWRCACAGSSSGLAARLRPASAYRRRRRCPAAGPPAVARSAWLLACRERPAGGREGVVGSFWQLGSGPPAGRTVRVWPGPAARPPPLLRHPREMIGVWARAGGARLLAGASIASIDLATTRTHQGQ